MRQVNITMLRYSNKILIPNIVCFLYQNNNTFQTNLYQYILVNLNTFWHFNGSCTFLLQPRIAAGGPEAKNQSPRSQNKNRRGSEEGDLGRVSFSEKKKKKKKKKQLNVFEVADLENF